MAAAKKAPENATHTYTHTHTHTLGTGKRGHYERGLFTGEISRISKISNLELENGLENSRMLLCSPHSGPLSLGAL